MNLQEAIEILEAHQKWRRGDDEGGNISPIGLGIAIDLILKSVKNRKQQITDAYDTGYGEGFNYVEGAKIQGSESYYNKKFKPNNQALGGL